MADSSSNSVKITIDVIDANSGERVSSVTKNLTSMGTAGKAAGASVAEGARQSTVALQETGTAGATAGQKVAAGMDEAGAHTLTNLDAVRLFRDEFGIHIPRSMEKTMAQSEAVMTVLGTLRTAMIGIGALGVFLALASEADVFWHKLMSAEDEVTKFDDKLRAAAGRKFFDDAQISMVAGQVGDLNKQLDQLDKKEAGSMTRWQRAGAILSMDPLHPSDNLVKPGVNPFRATEMSDKEVEQRNQDKEISSREPYKQEEERHNKRMTDIEVEARQASSMRAGAAQEEATYRAARDRANEEHTNRVNQANIAARQGGLKGVDANAPDPERDNALAKARADLNAKEVETSRATADAVRRLEDEANNASLKGYQLLMAQKQQAEREFTLAHGANQAAIAAIDKRYDAELGQRYDEQNRELDRQQRSANEAGLSGLARVTTRGRDQLADVKESDFFGNSDEQQNAAERRRASIQKQTDQDVQAEQERFRSTIDGLVDGSATHQITATERIAAAQKKQLDDLQKRFQDVYGGLDPDSALYKQGASQRDRGAAAINGSADAQRAQARQQILDQTEKAEAEASRSSLTREQQARQAILDEYAQRFQALEELRAHDAANADLYRRQEIAAEEAKNGKLLEQERQLRDQLAGTLRGLMNNPLGTLKQIGEDQASKFAADLILKHTGHGTGTVGASGGRGSAITDIFGGGNAPWMHHGQGQRGAAGAPGSPNHPAAPAPVVAASSTVSAAATTLRASAATIYVGQATFASMGSGGGSGQAGAALPAAASLARGGSSAVVLGGGGGSGNAGAAAAPLLLGGAASSSDLSSASAPNFGFPNLAPGSASSTADFGSDGSSGGGGSTTTMDRVGSAAGSAGGSIGGRIGSGLSDASQALQIGGKLAAGFAGGGDPSAAWGGKDGVFQGTGGGSLGMDESSQQLGSDLFNLDSPAGKTAEPGGAGGGGAASAMGAAGSAIGGGMEVFSALTGNGGAGGALQGAMGGMQLGAMVGGPIGAAVGAAAGALLGFIGFGGKAHAEQYYQKTVRPRIAGDLMGFGMGSMDYQSAYNDLISLDKQARDDMKKFGMGGKSVWNGKVHPDIINAQHELTREQKAGRSQYGMNAAEFHGGGQVLGFGDMGTGPDSGWIHALRGETVMHQSATAMHGDALGLMLAGADRQQMANHYGGGTTQPPSSGGDTHVHIHAIDTQSGLDFLMANKHGVRAAVNQSYTENSGGSDFA